MIPHPSYKNFDNDIALLHLSSAISGDNIGAVVPLLAADEPSLAADGTLATVTGWGDTSFGGPGSTILLQVTVPLLGPAACRRTSYGDTITDNMICAGFDDGGKDSCHGDSGGPLVVSDQQGGYRLTGIVSFGSGCAEPNTPGVYTRVSRYIDWLEMRTGLRFPSRAIDCGGVCSAEFDGDSVVTLRAMAEDDSVFSGWSGACSGADTTCTVTMDAAKTVTATFAAITAGACGSAAGQATLVAPSTNLCDAGAASEVSSANGAWAWTCAGVGSADTTCSAPGAPTSGGAGDATVTLTLAEACTGCVFESAPKTVAPPEGGPAGVEMPYGALEFTLKECPANQATLTASFSGALTAGMTYWKYTGPGWKELPDAVFNGNSVTITIVDNGDFDTDPRKGFIAGSGGPGRSTAIPTLSHAGLIALAGLLSWVGVGRMRRRKRA